MDSSEAACKNLVLDAGPLLSLTPLRGLAERYLTVPHVLSELKDKNAREHFERLGLSAGVKIEVREPDAYSLSQVVQFAKKTGDYSVLSHADLCVLALTLALHTQEEAEKVKREAEGAANLPDPAKAPVIEEQSTPATSPSEVPLATESSITEIEGKAAEKPGESSASSGESGDEDGHEAEEVLEDDPSSADSDANSAETENEPLDVTLEPIDNSETSQPSAITGDVQTTKVEPTQQTPLFEDPSDEDDGEGDWITPGNVEVYKSHALDLLPTSNPSSDPFALVSNKKGKGKGRRKQQDNSGEQARPKEQIAAGCMTADFAMQNVLLQMGLNLVGIEGKRIEKVKTWVLRCHACFKICKDSTKKFCPSCGNPTLLRTSVTAKLPTADDKTPALEVHLKKNFVYRTRGTIFSIPAPKPGNSKTGSGEGLILREDQTQYVRAKNREDGRKEREEKRILRNALEAAKTGATTGVKVGSWMDPDWIPEMMSVGTGGKGRRAPDPRTPIGADGMPIIGYGRKNPNERRRKK